MLWNFILCQVKMLKSNEVTWIKNKGADLKWKSNMAATYVECVFYNAFFP